MKNVLVFFLLMLAASGSKLSAQKTDERLLLPVESEREMRYGSKNDPTLPDWVRLMYSPDAKLVDVIEAREAYYLTHPFVKNQHTQFYKRLLRSMGKFIGPDGAVHLPNLPDWERSFQEYEALRNDPSRSPTSPWSCIGPFDYDEDAAGNSHAPGAAHVYTLERAPSNSQLFYAGTSTAGVWKTVDGGTNWLPVTQNLAFGHCSAVEIDFSNVNNVFIGGGGRVYKTVNGGTDWAQTGGTAFNASSHDVFDILMHPTNNQILFVATNRGLYRSTDGGTTLSQVINAGGGDDWFGEIEFKPGDPMTVYALLNGKDDLYTIFYRSTDGGITWAAMDNWPVVGFSGNYPMPFIGKTLASNAYVQFASNVNLGSPALPDFTVEMRVRLPAAVYDQTFITNKDWDSGANPGWGIFTKSSNGKWKFNIANAAGNRIDLDGNYVDDGDWHHIAIVYNKNGSKTTYTDGVLSNTTSTVITGDPSTALPFRLGADAENDWNDLDIEVSEVRIWDKALTAATMNNWLWIPVTASHPDWADLINYWKTNEGSGTTVADSKGGNTGTVNNPMYWGTGTKTISTTTLVGAEHQKRAEIAVTPGYPDRVYALLSGEINGGEGLFGVYKSEDKGTTWRHMCCGEGPGGPVAPDNQNLLGYDSDGQEEGGQFYYDLALAAGTDNSLHLGGVIHWVSQDSGKTWINTASWSNPDDPGYIHADIHDIHVYGPDVWVNCDGGIYKSTDGGTSVFNKKQNGIAGTDFWGFGQGWQDAQVMLGGTYHNSHLMKNNAVYNGGWVSYTGSADGIRGYVNPGKPTTVYNDSGKDILPAVRTADPIRTDYVKYPNASYLAGESCDLRWDPNNYHKMYSGVDGKLWKTEDDGTSWTLVKDFATTLLLDVEVSWANSQVIYVAERADFYSNRKVWKSVNGGTDWTNITPSSAVLNGNTTFDFSLTVDENNADIVWLTLVHPYGWYPANGFKVFKTIDGGTSWTNFTGTSLLTDEYPVWIERQMGTDGGVYLGTRRSVYYRKNGMSDWANFATQLPAETFCTRLVPSYKLGKIRNATTRSVWEADFYEPSAPIANVGVDKTTADCQRDTFYFVSRSVQSASGATWNWAFNPAPNYVSSATVENPKVVFGAAGNYSVTLTITDANGGDNQILNNFITVNAGCLSDTIPGKTLSLDGIGDYAVADAAMNLNSNTVTMTAWIKRNGAQNDWAGLVFARGGTTTSGLSIKDDNTLRYHWNDGNYGWVSGLVVPDNTWTHVALVITPTNAKIYMNGVAATNTTAHAAEAFDVPVRIGRDASSSTRVFKGLVDEVAIYKRALSQNEIRELMHLTKNFPDATPDPDLVSYYQMNELTGRILDRVATRHCSLVGDATRATSTVPTGKGFSSRATITASGSYDFGAAALTLVFPGPTMPNGEVCVTRIHQQPDQWPNNSPGGRGYWVVNNFGTNASFTTLTSAKFNSWGPLGGGNINNPDVFKLYKRASRADGATWGSILDSGDAATGGAHAAITFSTGNGNSSFSQFAVMQSAAILPLDLTGFEASKRDEKSAILNWTTAHELAFSHFEIERSGDGVSFEKIGTIDGGRLMVDGLASYQFIDYQPVSGENWYRLRMVDSDGSWSNSPVRTVIFGLKKEAGLFPNPVSTGGSPVLKSNLDEAFKLVIFTADGKKIREIASLRSGENAPLGDLPAGLYFYELEGETLRTQGRLVIE